MTDIAIKLPRVLGKYVMTYLMRDMGIGLELMTDIISYHEVYNALYQSHMIWPKIAYGIAHAFTLFKLYRYYPEGTYDGCLPNDIHLEALCVSLDEYIIEGFPDVRPLGPYWIHYIFDYNDGGQARSNVKRCLMHLIPEDRYNIADHVLDEMFLYDWNQMVVYV